MNAAISRALESLKAALEEALKHLEPGYETLNATKVSHAAKALLGALEEDSALGAQVEHRLAYWQRACIPGGDLVQAAADAAPALRRLYPESSPLQKYAEPLVRSAECLFGAQPHVSELAQRRCPGSTSKWDVTRGLLRAASNFAIMRCWADADREPLLQWFDAIHEAVEEAKRLRVDAIDWLTCDGLWEMLRDRDIAPHALRGLWDAVNAIEEMAAEILGDEAAGDNPEEPPAPRQYCMSWREILDTLGLKNNEENRNRVRTANEDYEGPIIFIKRGGQPKAERMKLLDWWNGLGKRWQEIQDRDRDRKATLADTHNYGRDGTVIPAINGAEKRRRSQNIAKHPKTSE